MPDALKSTPPTAAELRRGLLCGLVACFAIGIVAGRCLDQIFPQPIPDRVFPQPNYAATCGPPPVGFSTEPLHDLKWPGWRTPQ